MILLTAGMLIAGEDLKTAMYGATSQTQIGEFSFIIHAEANTQSTHQKGFVGHKILCFL